MLDKDQLKNDIEAAEKKYANDHSSYITLHDYFGTKIHSDEDAENATKLLSCVNALLAEFVSFNGILHKDTDTGTYISGSKEGRGDGGFRLKDSTTGRPGSAHKEAMGVDICDPDNSLDQWINRDILIRFGLWREAMQWTPGWAHVQSREPKSGNRSFNP